MCNWGNAKRAAKVCRWLKMEESTSNKILDSVEPDTIVLESENIENFKIAVKSDSCFWELFKQDRFAEMNTRIEEIKRQFNIKPFVEGSLVQHLSH